MRTGELICENTHAKFLNNLLKIHLHNYRQCKFELPTPHTVQDDYQFLFARQTHVCMPHPNTSH